MNKAIACYRVSTDRQGKSGLGLEAQQEAARLFADRQGYQVEVFLPNGRIYTVSNYIPSEALIINNLTQHLSIMNSLLIGYNALLD